MGVVEVDPAGLQLLAKDCEELSIELATAIRPDADSNSFQPSTAAVRTVNAAISSAAHSLAARMSATAEKLSASAAEYVSQDHASASAIEAVSL